MKSLFGFLADKTISSDDANEKSFIIAWLDLEIHFENILLCMSAVFFAHCSTQVVEYQMFWGPLND